MNEAVTVQRQLTRLAIALASGAILIFAMLTFNSYRDQAARQILYDYHLVSETSARAMYAADARMRRPLGMRKFSKGEIADVNTYTSTIRLEYEIMMKHADEILALDQQFVNTRTAGVIAGLRRARDELQELVASNADGSLAVTELIVGNDLDIGLIGEQLFRIHHAAFQEKQRNYERQKELQSVGLLIVLSVVCGLGALFWIKTRGAIAASMVREREAVRASVLAEQSSVAKTDFLSRMSHELRTPLNAILGFGQLLKQGTEATLTQRQTHQVDEILSAGSHLLELVNEVLDLNLIERGKLKLDIETLTVATEIESCLYQVQPDIRRNSLRVTMDLPKTNQVEADPVRFRQVVLNLLSNAIKFNRPGGEIRVSSRVLSPQRLRISIQDSGHGIPREAQARLFNAFERVESQSSSVEGAGIGLALSKQLVNLMGGGIGFESQLSRGSTFWFELPVPLEESDALQSARYQ